jgi:hypothetical protein
VTEEVFVSASQISAFEDCQRKWAWRTIAKISSPPTKAAALGTEVDSEQLQPYLRDGREFDYTRESGYIAASALAYLPPPQSKGLVVQKKFIMPSPSWAKRAFAYLGYKDLWLPVSSVLPGIKAPETCQAHEDCRDHPELGRACAGSIDIPAVVDFKTTSDLKWAKDEEALRTDPQAVIYAMNALFETEAPAVDLVWIYMRTRGARKAQRTHLRVYREEVAERFAVVDRVGLQIANTRAVCTDPLTLPPNPDACSKYGGCPYRDKCNLSPSEILNTSVALSRLPPIGALSNMASTADVLANLRKRASAPSAPSAPVTTAPLGINPPEKDLPPAPAVGVVAQASAPPVAPVEVVKPRRGRPPKVTAIETPQAEAASASVVEEVTPSEITLRVEPRVQEMLSSGGIVIALRAAAKAFLDATENGQ